MFAVWLWKCLQIRSHLHVNESRLGDEDVRHAEVAVKLRDLVLKNQMVAESVPRELASEPVILMEVVTSVREDEIGLDVLQASNASFTSAPLYGRKLSGRSSTRMSARGVREERVRARPRLLRPRTRRGDTTQVTWSGRRLRQREQRSTATNFDVVGVTADCEHAPTAWRQPTATRRALAWANADVAGDALPLEHAPAVDERHRGFTAASSAGTSRYSSSA